MLIGYARTSTMDQKAGLDAQIAELRAAGVEECRFRRSRPSITG
jgi:DNA invertase Pin-like site-specific DNA recombinase